mmetsp:Transcript_3291/g.8507  ORF Transcript_3291/g.8507 Transcript_3291/m.8507 type:complete len:88 (-) Transcript_3291:1021-1284(-)
MRARSECRSDVNCDVTEGRDKDDAERRKGVEDCEGVFGKEEDAMLTVVVVGSLRIRPNRFRNGLRDLSNNLVASPGTSSLFLSRKED